MTTENQRSSKGDTFLFFIVAICALALAGWTFARVIQCPTAVEAPLPAAPASEKSLAAVEKALSAQRADIEAAKKKVVNAKDADLSGLYDEVAKSKAIQTDLEKLVLDLLDLAKTDPDAQALVKKYNIQQSTTPPAR